MAKITVGQFRGMAPRMDARALAIGSAVRAVNCKLWNNQLRPWRAPAWVLDLENTGEDGALTIHRAFAEAGLADSGAWLHWPAVVDVVRGPVLGDTYQRLFFTGTGKPQYTDRVLALQTDEEEFPESAAYPLRSRDLGVVGPSAAPSSHVAVGDSSPIKKTHTYTFAFVEEYPKGSGQWYEGKPSVRALSVERMTYEDVTLSNIPKFTSKTRNVPYKRIYRATSLTASVSSYDVDADAGEALIYLNTFHNVKVGDSIVVSGADSALLNGTFTVTRREAEEPALLIIAMPVGAEALEEVLGDISVAMTYPPVFIAEIAMNVERWVDRVREDEPDPVYAAYAGIGDYPAVSTLDLFYDVSEVWGFRLAKRKIELNAGQWVRFKDSDTQPSNWNRGFEIGSITERDDFWLSATLLNAPATSDTIYIKLEYAKRNLYSDRRTTTKVPRPSAKFTLAENYESVGEADKLLRSYVVVFVSEFHGVAEDSVPSPPSALLTVLPGDVVELTDLPQPVAPHHVTRKDIYRTASDGNSTQYFFVGSAPANASRFLDDVPEEALGEVLGSAGYYPPPADMHSLGALGNGMMLGASGRQLCVSEIYRPHAWNPLNQITLPYPIVGIGYYETTAVVLTERNPHLVTGNRPDYLSDRELPLNQGCVSKRSIVSAADGVYYASPDGLMRVGVNGPQLVSAPYFTRDEWRALNPQSLLGCVFEGCYFGFYEPADGDNRGFILDLNPAGAGLTDLNFYATAVFHDPLADYLYICDGYGLYRFDAGESSERYDWHSGALVAGDPMLFTAVRVLADSYNDLQLKVYNREAGGAWREVSSHSVMDRRPLRLASQSRSREWQLRLAGTDAISAVELADSVAELR